MRFNTRPDGRLETVETIHDAEARERQLRAAIARDRGTLRRMLDGNEPFHCDASPGLPLAVAAEVIANAAATSKSEIVAQALANVGKLPVADTPAAEAVDYLQTVGNEVPDAQRSGLWHYKYGQHWSRAMDAARLMFGSFPYRRAAPGTKEGDSYNEAAYAGVAG